MNKAILLLILCLLKVALSEAQELEVASKLKLAERATDTTYTVVLTIKYNSVADPYTVTVIDRNSGTATQGVDYRHRLASGQILTSSTGSPNTFTVDITILKDDQVDPDETIELFLEAKRTKDSAANSIPKEVVFTISDFKKSSVAKKKGGDDTFIADSLHRDLLLFTGASFDFFGKSQFKNFAGSVTAHLPDLVRIGSIKGTPITLGLDGSIFHYHYYTADTSGGRNYSESYLVNPNVRRLVPDSTRYVRSSYALNSKTDIRVWGYNAQLLIGLGKPPQDKKQSSYVRAFLTVDAEVLVTTYRTTLTKTNVRTDTAIYRSSDARRVALYQQTRPSEVVNNRAYGYFGVGLTTYMSFAKSFDFYAQGVIGKTTNNPSLEDIPVTVSDPEFRLQRLVNDAWGSYYLVKGRITEKYTGLNGTVGVEIRGLLPKNAPFVAAFLGIQFTPEKIKAFFKS
ncbi:hypothetical protein [Hymenobacter sp. GOD-10R]|uniref:hypothetical protein n=1 Tax=Hymenobacter sp. GOD-10R TaxID=3093922 RepID=UPI002D77B108|nr:hypothetical protein [Hymenobacter sp. GOD-10R]WRQ31693.1 hypothetical protein SD425_28695 [Hymenobacter sp. GOD-10R]